MGEWTERVLAALAGDAGAALPLALLAAALGFAHALLPGHGKALLAARHGALGETMEGRAAVLGAAMLDGLLLAGSRTLVSAALVVGAARLGEALGRPLPPLALQVVAGVVLLGLAVRMALGARDGAASRETGRSRRDTPALGTPLLVLALTPEPLSISIVALALGGRPELGLALLGFAVGLGLALGLAAMLGALGGERLGPLVRDPGRSTRLVHAALIALAGVAVLAQVVLR